MVMGLKLYLIIKTLDKQVLDMVPVLLVIG